MSEQEGTTQEQERQGAGENPEAGQGEPGDLGDAGKKALAAEREARKTAEATTKALQAKLEQIENANMSELEKAQKAASDAQDQLAKITQENLRNSVALSKGVPADLAPFLTGDSEEALSSQADTLLARLNAPTTPKPDPTQGGGQGQPHALNSDGLTEALKSKLGI